MNLFAAVLLVISLASAEDSKKAAKRGVIPNNHGSLVSGYGGHNSGFIHNGLGSVSSGHGQSQGSTHLEHDCEYEDDVTQNTNHESEVQIGQVKATTSTKNIPYLNLHPIPYTILKNSQLPVKVPVAGPVNKLYPVLASKPQPTTAPVHDKSHDYSDFFNVDLAKHPSLGGHGPVQQELLDNHAYFQVRGSLEPLKNYESLEGYGPSTVHESWQGYGSLQGHGPLQDYGSLQGRGSLQRYGSLQQHGSLQRYGSLQGHGTLQGYGSLQGRGPLEEDKILEGEAALKEQGVLEGRGLLGEYKNLGQLVLPHQAQGYLGESLAGHSSFVQRGAESEHDVFGAYGSLARHALLNRGRASLGAHSSLEGHGSLDEHPHDSFKGYESLDVHGTYDDYYSSSTVQESIGGYESQGGYATLGGDDLLGGDGSLDEEDSHKEYSFLEGGHSQTAKRESTVRKTLKGRFNMSENRQEESSPPTTKKEV